VSDVLAVVIEDCQRNDQYLCHNRSISALSCYWWSQKEGLKSSS